MTTPTDRPNLDRLRELDKAATSGPWRATDSEVCDDMPASGMAVVSKGEYGHPPAVALVCDEWYENDPGEPSPSDDAALIAAYRNATPALVAALTDVLALHQLVAHCPDENCTARTCANCGGRYPCPTVRAISAHLDLTKGA